MVYVVILEECCSVCSAVPDMCKPFVHRKDPLPVCHEILQEETGAEMSGLQ